MKRHKYLGWFAIALALTLSLGFTAAFAQTTSATVTGTVTDPSGAAIPGASVILENTQTHLQSKVNANSSGFYRVAGLIPGIYRATITRNGFKSAIRDGIELHGQDQVSLNYSLQVGSVSESVTVTSSEPLLQSESATVSTVIEATQIENTPLNGRNVMNLSALTPGVVPQGATSGNPLNNQAAIGNYTNPAGWGNYQIGGAVTGQNITYVDGAPANVVGQNWMGFIPAQDSIQEFRVQTNNISSEFGEYYGGVLLFSTKSGANDVHGSAYEYLKNTIFNANSFFNNRTHVVRPPVVQNQYGASLGGPILKNKAFLFGNWEGFANRTGIPYVTVVPTVAETNGDFRGLVDKNGAPINVVDTTTNQVVSCNGIQNTVCPDPTALYMASVYKYWAQPNIPNVYHGANNFSTNASSGGNSNQVVVRSDFNVGKNQMFARYTLWKTNTLGTNYYHNTVPQPQVLSTTNQAVVGDTVAINSTTVADVRASYLRFKFISQPPFMGHVDLSKFGPAYATLANQVTWDTIPIPLLSGYGNAFPISIINVIQYYNFDIYDVSGNITKTWGRHAIKIGTELIRKEAYLAGGGQGPAGAFTFQVNKPTTDIFANFMLGADIPVTSNIVTSRGTSSINYTQGYYINDTYQMNSRVTLTGGLRWDLPGGILEKHDVNTVFLPTVASPLGTINNPATGTSQQLVGNLALVNTSAYPSRYDDIIHKHLFAPNLGLSARVLPDTVVRGGFGMSFISYTNFTGLPSPYGSPITQFTTPATGPLSNPFPQLNGVLTQPIGRNPAFSNLIQGISVSGIVAGAKYPYVMQWNLNVQHQMSPNSVFQIGYQGSKGTHIKAGRNLNQLADGYAAQAETQYKNLVAGGASAAQADAQTFLNVKVANPLAGKLSSASAYNGATIAQGQLLKRFPQFATAATNSSKNDGTSIYHSLQASYNLRLHAAGTFYAAYTWAKLIGTVDSSTGFLEGNTVGAVQNGNNYKGERSVESFDVPQRLVLNYSLALPIGKGQHWMSNAGDGLNRVIGGWRASSITTFQKGYPLAITAQANDLQTSFGAGTIRPNRVSGCQANISGSAQARLNQWFNTACFVQPPTPFSYGNEARVDSELRGAGVNNWDLAIAKQTNITERIKLNFEAEFLNAFNRVQFGPPALKVGSSTFGIVSSTLNLPRAIQFALRTTF
jgi:hypothetical protein